MKRKTKILTELEKVRILAEANMKLAGVPALHDTLETLQNQEKYEELAIMNDVYKKANQVDAVVSQAASQAMPEPSQQLFTIAEVEHFLERQKEICKQQYNLYCTDRELPISDVCRKMILEAPTPNIVKS